MKKFFAMLAVALMLGSVVSCNTKRDKGAVSPAQVDSISRMLGELNGTQLKMMLQNDSTADLKQLLAGLQAGLAIDTNQYYSQGANIGMQMQGMLKNIKERFGVEINTRAFMSELKKAAIDKADIDEEAMRALSGKLDSTMRAIEKQRMIKNDDEGKAFIKSKLAEGGYQQTASGLVYKVITEGEGNTYADGDSIEVTYTGKHVNGITFDQGTHKFTTAGVVPGFAEALRMMKPGTKLEVILPYDLAYGENGQQNYMGGGYAIEPYETLVFEMETK